MIQSPLIDELLAEIKQAAILDGLEARFGEVPAAFADAVKAVDKERHLQKLLKDAAVCSSLSAFKASLQAQRSKKSKRF